MTKQLPTVSAPEFAVVRLRLPSKRRKRWVLPNEAFALPVVFEAQSLARRFELQLRPSPSLLDPQFVLLRRWSNHTEMLSPRLAEQSCFYRSDARHRAAVALCDGMVRPLTYYRILKTTELKTERDCFLLFLILSRFMTILPTVRPVKVDTNGPIWIKY
jgi:hypothetical protein